MLIRICTSLWISTGQNSTRNTHYRNPERMYAREDMNIGAAQAAEGRVLDTEIDLETLGGVSYNLRSMGNF